MEGNGGSGDGSGSAAPPWDLGMHWAAPHAGNSSYPQQQQPPLVLRAGGVPSQHQLEQLTCLKLGKRPCCWAGAAAGNSNQQAAGAAGAGQPPHQQQVRGNGTASSSAEGKRKEKAAASPAAAAAPAPRCQVEGCHVALVGANAKEYHRRHKVCEEHSKAPRVVVLGAEQRFCQQCSRFHAISEFDDAKRSCRRRLAGHNERRRKSNASEAMARGAAHPHGMLAASFGHGFLPPCGLPASPAGALSLLSSARGGAAGAPWLVPAAAPDISARSSAALDELIAENRAALLAWQFFTSDRSATGRHPASTPPSAGRALQLPPPPDQAAGGGWHPHAHNNGAGGGQYHAAPPCAGHTTLDLMQRTAATTSTGAGAPPFRPVPERAVAWPPRTTTGGDAAGCSSDAWAPAGGAHAM